MNTRRWAILMGLLAACQGDEVTSETDLLPLDTDETTSTETSSETETEDTDSETTLAQAVCDRWRGDRVDLDEGSWSGNVNSCSVGALSQVGIDNTLKLVNLYRFIAGQDPVSIDANMSDGAQACSLMMDANNALSHSPPPDWDCYTGQGADSAGDSNIATTPSVQAVDLYMVDPGNETTLGHRRWILGSWVGPVGIGGTDSYSCLAVNGDGTPGSEWVAWPPPGVFPLTAVDPSWTDIDATGWSLQSDDIDLSGASVTVTKGGQDMPMQVTLLLDWYGSESALSMIPQGWQTSPGTYRVEVSGVAVPISYDVDVVDCAALP